MNFVISSSTYIQKTSQETDASNEKDEDNKEHIARSFRQLYPLKWQ